MTTVMHDSAVFFNYALVAIFAQNAIFTRGLGVSRMIHLVSDEATSSPLFGVLLCVTQLLAAPAGWGMGVWLLNIGAPASVRPLAYVLCVSAVCGVEYLILGVAKPPLPRREELVALIPLVGFNSTVVGTMLVTTTQSYTLRQSVGFGLGSGIGFCMAVFLVTEAQRRLRSRSIPDAFKGLPITLIYIGILALAIYGFTGHTVVI